MGAVTSSLEEQARSASASRGCYYIRVAVGTALAKDLDRPGQPQID